MLYAEVLVDVANRRLDRSYHYLLSEGINYRVGMRVLVPLKHRLVQGLIIDITAKLPAELTAEQIRPVFKALERETAVPEDLIFLARWLAETTICSIAQSLHTVWPLFKGKVEKWVVPLFTSADNDFQALKLLDQETFKALAVLQRSRRKALPLATYLKRAQLAKPALEELENQGWLRQEFRFISRWNLPAVSERHLPAAEEAFDAGFNEGFIGDQALSKQLTPEQESAVAGILAALQIAAEQKTSRTLLLHGVTGSGKTEVYLQVINRLLAEGGDVILLVPEIALTPQISDYFQAQFDSRVAVLHSGLKATEKVRVWEEIIAGQKRLVIGARSAVFAPLPNLKLIIMDEEHDSAYKQSENPKYHARDVARKRMEQQNGVVLLASATPSLEAYAAAQTGKVNLIVLKKRAGGSSLPPVEIVDMRQELLQGNRSIFSDSLQAKLRDRVIKGEQSMLFLNRRGYSTFVVCRECGYTVRCPNCDVSLTFHSAGHKMCCHYCNHAEEPPLRCSQCGSRYIRFFGQGTQRVEEDLQSLQPDIRIMRLDWDTTRSKEAHRLILESFRRQEAQVLVGTQMMAKGLDFPNVTLVGVIAADQALNMPDFRARERTFQLLTQVSGRAGRSKKAGEVVIQTYSPADRAIVKAAAHDFAGFFWDEIRYRQNLGYPPFTHLIRVLLLHEVEEKVIRAAHDLAAFLRARMTGPEYGNTEIDILGPAPALFLRLKNRYRWQVAVKAKRMDILRAFLHLGVKDLYNSPSSNGINLNIEVDPLSS
ncbi:MAG: primosomal protein N' [Desulfitobacteriaceae bacterium]|nr:primosomal protein N' [Desulfitobacteriaceae bacterium]MDD4400532.1 primosomal protein N' [Desulfitobacteriaceae bacterium]